MRYIMNEKQRAAKRKHDREYQRKRRADNPGLKTKEYAEWRKQKPEAYKAHRQVQYALKKGEIKKMPCEKCGEKRRYRVHAHHDDYAKPLLVRWLCVVHHKEVHPGTSGIHRLSPAPLRPKMV